LAALARSLAPALVARLALAAVVAAMAPQARADCPVAMRTLSEREQQGIVSMSEAIRNVLPPTPAGWSLKELGALSKNAAAKAPTTSPAWTTCGNTDVPPGWNGTYTWDEQAKRNYESETQQNAKLKAADAYTPQEQQEMGELSRQARDLERKSIALMRTDPGESARLRAEMKPFTDKAYALRKAHDERVFPQLDAIRKEHAARVVSPMVVVSAYVSPASPLPDGVERLQIPGATTAFVNARNRELVLSIGQFPSAKESGGLGTQPRVLVVMVQGDRGPAEAIARLIAGSGLHTLGKK
jgi:hypothetical protein